MSLHYLLDGYNVLNQVPLWAGMGGAQGRQAMMSWIAGSRPQGSPRNALTVVFDGSDEHFGSAQASGVRVIFSKGESADELIKRMVESAPKKDHYVVVSDDKGIKLYVRALGAAVLSVRQFTAGLVRPAKTRVAGHGPAVEKGKYVSLTQAQKINRELEKIWLKDR